jgi:hypothetical protein
MEFAEGRLYFLIGCKALPSSVGEAAIDACKLFAAGAILAPQARRDLDSGIAKLLLRLFGLGFRRFERFQQFLRHARHCVALRPMLARSAPRPDGLRRPIWAHRRYRQ